MIKCHIGKKKWRSKVKTKGTARDLVKETAMLISCIYKGIKEEYPDLAEAFKESLLAVLLHPQSPVWKEEDHG